MTLSKRDIKDIHASVHDWLGFDLTDEQIIDFAKRHPIWTKDFEINGMDTCSREAFASYFAKDLIGRDWPMNMEVNKEERESSFKELREAAVTAGYKPVEWEDE